MIVTYRGVKFKNLRTKTAYEKFIQGLVDRVIDDNITDGALRELICRQLCKAGYLQKNGEYWEKKDE